MFFSINSFLLYLAHCLSFHPLPHLLLCLTHCSAFHKYLLLCLSNNTSCFMCLTHCLPSIRISCCILTIALSFHHPSCSPCLSINTTCCILPSPSTKTRTVSPGCFYFRARWPIAPCLPIPPGPPGVGGLLGTGWVQCLVCPIRKYKQLAADPPPPSPAASWSRHWWWGWREWGKERERTL